MEGQPCRIPALAFAPLFFRDFPQPSASFQLLQHEERKAGCPSLAELGGYGRGSGKQS